MSMFYELMMRKKGMPERYQEVEYIESTGTQYIDTGYIPNVDDVIDTDLQKVSQLWAEDFFFGIANADSSKGALWIEQSSNNKWYIRFASTSSSGPDSTGTDRENKIHITLKKESFISSGGTTATPSFAGTMNSTSLTLFGRFNSTQTTVITSALKMWNFQITRNGTLVRNYIPVYDTLTNKYGMWESVQRKFYGNDGIGDFKGSIVGYTIVGSPTITDGVLINPTSSNYLIIDKYLSADRIEVSIPFSFDTLNWNDIFWGKRNQQQNVLLEITSGGVMRIYFNQGIPGYFDTARLNSNINYRIDITLTYDNFAYKIINEDSNIIVKEDLKERTTKAIPYLDIPCFGRNASNSKIAIKDTIIKADNKLWFNGQEG